MVRRSRCARDVGRCLDELIRLHHSRWKQGSEWLTPEVQRTLQEAADRLVADDGLRLSTVEIGGRVIGATVFAATGGAVTALLTAFDPEWGRFAGPEFDGGRYRRGVSPDHLVNARNRALARMDRAVHR